MPSIRGWSRRWHSATNDPRHSYSAARSVDKRPRFVDLEWLMGGGPGRSNTLYLTAPQPEFERLSPVLGGLLADVKDCIHAWDIAGRRLDKPLLILIDEAGAAGARLAPRRGVDHRRPRRVLRDVLAKPVADPASRRTLADAVLSGHRSKCFFAGVDDLTTTRYLTNLLGAEYVTRLSTSDDVPSLLGGRHVGRRSVSRAEQRVDFAPPNTVRQMVPGEAVLPHGTLPPIHLSTVRWWEQTTLAALVPLDGDGNPSPPRDLPTCPLGPDAPAAKTPLVDESTLDSALAGLPKAKPVPLAHKPTAAEQPELPLENPPERAVTTRATVVGEVGAVTQRTACVVCGTILRSGEGRTVKKGRRIFAYCNDAACLPSEVAAASHPPP